MRTGNRCWSPASLVFGFLRRGNVRGASTTVRTARAVWSLDFRMRARWSRLSSRQHTLIFTPLPYKLQAPSSNLFIGFSTQFLSPSWYAALIPPAAMRTARTPLIRCQRNLKIEGARGPAPSRPTRIHPGEVGGGLALRLPYACPTRVAKGAGSIYSEVRQGYEIHTLISRGRYEYFRPNVHHA